MGLFGKLFGRKSQEVVETQEVVALAVPDGKASVKVFTYDGGPLGKVDAGAEVMLTLYGGKTYRMASAYTGTVMNDDAILAYEGKPVGFLATGQNTRIMKAALKKHEALLLHATVTGWAGGGWPEITVHFNRKWLKDYSEQ